MDGRRTGFQPDAVAPALLHDPNTAVLTLKSRTGRTLTLKAASVGGGRIRVTEIDGVPADFGGDSNTLIIHNEAPATMK